MEIPPSQWWPSPQEAVHDQQQLPPDSGWAPRIPPPFMPFQQNVESSHHHHYGQPPVTPFPPSGPPPQHLQPVELLAPSGASNVQLSGSHSDNGHGLDGFPHSKPLSSEGGQNQREMDQNWLNAFIIERRGTCLAVATQEALRKVNHGTFKISEAQLLFYDCWRTKQKLAAVHKKLSESVDSGDGAWEESAQEASKLKSQLESCLARLCDPEYLTRLESEVAKRKRKRERIGRKKLARRKMFQEREEQSQKLHQKIDTWMETIRQEYLAAEMEKKMKAEADVILGEVRRKRSEANRFLETVKAVVKLRGLKKQAAGSKGLYTTLDSDKQFSKVTGELEKLLEIHLSEYREEERTLQVMLDEEHQESRESVLKSRQHDRNKKLQIMQQETVRWLFGPETHIHETDVRFPAWEFFTRTERDLNALVQVRRSWDIHLVPLNTERSSGPPVGWVIPAEPSSEMWAMYLDKNPLP